MQYNLHPLFVHFPIALLFLYSIIKILPLKRWMPTVDWKSVERVLLLVGVAGAFLALATGEIAEDLVRPNRRLVEAHSFFASLATWLYGALLAGEVLSMANPILLPKMGQGSVAKLARFLERVLCNPSLSRLLAFFALVAISVTGLLGGVMVYGTSADPVAGMVLKMLGISL